MDIPIFITANHVRTKLFAAEIQQLRENVNIQQSSFVKLERLHAQIQKLTGINYRLREAYLREVNFVTNGCIANRKYEEGLVFMVKVSAFLSKTVYIEDNRTLLQITSIKMLFFLYTKRLSQANMALQFCEKLFRSDPSKKNKIVVYSSSFLYYGHEFINEPKKSLYYGCHLLNVSHTTGFYGPNRWIQLAIRLAQTGIQVNEFIQSHYLLRAAQATLDNFNLTDTSSQGYVDAAKYQRLITYGFAYHVASLLIEAKVRKTKKIDVQTGFAPANNLILIYMTVPDGDPRLDRVPSTEIDTLALYVKLKDLWMELKDCTGEDLDVTLQGGGEQKIKKISMAMEQIKRLYRFND